MTDPAPDDSAYRGWPWLIFVAALALAGLRAPHLLSEPRFWAEEASVYFAEAWNSGSLAALAHVPPYTAAYVALSVSVPATLAARWLPIEAAPFATTYAAFGAVAVALAVLSFQRSTLWSRPAGNALACAAALLAPSSLGEVWLNATNAQVYCGLVALAILCEELRLASPRRVALYVVLLLVCGLSGVYTAFLLPAFAWKRWAEPSRAASWALGAVALTAGIQLAVFAAAWSAGTLHPAKLHGLDWVRAATYAAYAQFVVPLGLSRLVLEFGEPTEVVAALAAGGRRAWLVMLAAAGALCCAAAFVALADREPRSARNGLVIAVACLLVLTTVFSHAGRTVGRYAVLSGIALLWLLLSRVRPLAPGRRLVSLAAATVFGMALLVGAAGYRSDAAFLCPVGCPRWSDEVRQWRADPSYAPQVWPVVFPRGKPQWRVRLAPPPS